MAHKTVLDQDKFAQLIKGELINDDNYKNFYQIEHYNLRTGFKIIIDSAEIKSILLQEDIEYKYHISILNSKIERLIISNGSFPSLSFHDIEFEENGIFQIDEGLFSKFYLSGSISKSWYINGGNFDSFYVGNIGFESLTINGGVFKDLYLSGIKGKSLFFRGGTYTNLRFSGGAEQNDCLLSGLYFSGGFYNQVSIFGLSSIDKCYITTGYIENFILNSEGLRNLFIDGSLRDFQIGNEQIYDPIPVVKNLFIQQLSKINIGIKNINLNKLNFTDSYLHKDSVVRLVNLEINSLLFDNFTNYGSISFNSIKLTCGNYLTIQYSDLGKTTFINCMLSESTFTLNSSKIVEIFISGTDLPESIDNVDDIERRLGYAQMKKVYDNRGDSIGHSIHYSHEMNAYLKTLSYRNNPYGYINLILNKYSNNHGQSWQRSLCALILTSISLYLIYCIILGFSIALPTTTGAFSQFTELASYFFEYLNPVHKTDYISDALNISKDSTTYARWWEGLSRIPIGYLIYQFVQSFRKFGRK